MNCNTVRTAPARRNVGLVSPFFGTLMNDVLQSPIGEAIERAQVLRRPAANILKSDAAYTIQLSVPGLSKKDISIKLEENVLTISSDREAQEQEYQLREFDYSNIKRSFTLPKNIARDKVEASFKAGILTVVLPLAPEAQPRTVVVK